MPAVMRLAEVLGCLSLGSDLADGFRLEKAMRTAVLATSLADAIGAGAEARTAAYWAAVVRFIGCTAFAAEEARYYSGGDDNQLRATLAKVDFGSIADFASRAIPNIGKGARFVRRVTALARLLGDPSAPIRHAHAQCEVGAHLARVLELGDGVMRVLDLRDERWDGRGPRKKIGGEELPLAARLVDVADVAELFHAEAGIAAGIEAARARRGGQLDPTIVDALERDGEEHLRRLEASSIFDDFLAAEGPTPRTIDSAGLRRTAAAYASVIDLRSFFTLTHSSGTAKLTERACAAAGIDGDEREAAFAAACLHDIGNLAVPGGLLDKPAPLTRWERERVRGHAAHTTLVLRAAPCLASVADVASSAHEHGCGEGYPRSIGPGGLSLAARIVMAADVYHALREERAHRPALAASEAERTLREMASAGRLCGAATRHVLEAAGHPIERRSSIPRGLSEREVEVLRLVAIGRTNKEIGDLLDISPRTAQKHVMNVYDKLGVSSRAAAALFAVEHGLLAVT